MSDQTYATHRRFDPLYHFVALPLAFALVVIGAILAWKHAGLAGVWQLVLAILVLFLALKIRIYALRVQDRLIRLEEGLRMERLLPEDLKQRIPRLRPEQCVGLRFAADAELAERMQEALTGDLSGEAIKKRIKTWRPDDFRV